MLLAPLMVFYVLCSECQYEINSQNMCFTNKTVSHYLQGKIRLDPALPDAKTDLMLQAKQEKPPTMSVW